MTQTELIKTRTIAFHDAPPEQAKKALRLLEGLPNIEAGLSPAPQQLWVRYSLENYSLAGIEAALASLGFELDHSLYHKLVRALAHYCEEVQCENLRSPARLIKSREVFVKVWEHHAHGDRDETPEEWREYR
jgi:hypothetical protein